MTNDFRMRLLVGPSNLSMSNYLMTLAIVTAATVILQIIGFGGQAFLVVLYYSSLTLSGLILGPLVD
ncbi:MAG: hypothetical protein ACFFER_14810 [Candidatus Thorarchaeota archaeon]